jgi:hypothetical protein
MSKSLDPTVYASCKIHKMTLGGKSEKGITVATIEDYRNIFVILTYL